MVDNHRCVDRLDTVDGVEWALDMMRRCMMDSMCCMMNCSMMIDMVESMMYYMVSSMMSNRAIRSCCHCGHKDHHNCRVFHDVCLFPDCDVVW